MDHERPIELIERPSSLQEYIVEQLTQRDVVVTEEHDDSAEVFSVCGESTSFAEACSALLELLVTKGEKFRAIQRLSTQLSLKRHMRDDAMIFTVAAAGYLSAQTPVDYFGGTILGLVNAFKRLSRTVTCVIANDANRPTRNYQAMQVKKPPYSSPNTVVVETSTVGPAYTLQSVFTYIWERAVKKKTRVLTFWGKPLSPDEGVFILNVHFAS